MEARDDETQEQPVTFIVRVTEGRRGFRAVIERVKTGRKERVDTAEGIGRAIAAMTRED